MVEHWSEKPGVPGSTPGLGTTSLGARFRTVEIISSYRSVASTRTDNCSKCGALKVRSSSGKSRCYECQRRRDTAYYRQSAVRRMQLRDRHLKRKYGTSVRELEALPRRQDGRCAICRRPWRSCKSAKRVRVDHDHESGRIRGLLCNGCNTAIGLFEEHLDWLSGAIVYLSRGAARD